MRTKINSTKNGYVNFLIKRAALGILSLIILLLPALHPVAAFAESKTVTFELELKSVKTSMEMWHYSGGYWKVGNTASNSVTISDASIGKAINIGAFLSSRLACQIKLNLSAEAYAKIKTGDEITMRFEDNGVPVRRIFDSSSLSASYSDGVCTLSVKPIFNISSLRTMDDYVAGLNVNIPIIDSSFGENHYALYVGSSSKGDGRGWYSDSSPNLINASDIHPIMIASSGGKLKSGYTINNQVSTFQSDGYNVGNGTFKNGGAVGLKFIFPFKFRISAVRTEVAEEKTEEKTTEVPVYTPDDGPSSDDDSGSSGESTGDSDADDEFDPSDWRLHRTE